MPRPSTKSYAGYHSSSTPAPESILPPPAPDEEEVTHRIQVGYLFDGGSQVARENTQHTTHQKVLPADLKDSYTDWVPLCDDMDVDCPANLVDENSGNADVDDSYLETSVRAGQKRKFVDNSVSFYPLIT